MGWNNTALAERPDLQSSDDDHAAPDSELVGHERENLRADGLAGRDHNVHAKSFWNAVGLIRLDRGDRHVSLADVVDEARSVTGLIDMIRW